MNSLTIDPLWCVVENKFEIDNNKSYEGIFAQGNGYMSVRGCLEEGLSLFENKMDRIRAAVNVTSEEPDKVNTKKGTYVPGITGIHPNVNEEMINLPWFMGLHIWFEGEKLDMVDSEISEYIRWLDLRDGTLNRNFIWRTKSGGELEVKVRRFLSMSIKNLCVQEIDIRSLSAEGKLEVKSSIDGNVLTNGFNHFKKISAVTVDGKYIGMEIKTDKQNRVFELSNTEVSGSGEIEVESDETAILQKCEVSMTPQMTVEVIKLTTVSTDKDMGGGNPKEKCTEAMKASEQLGVEGIYKGHLEKWNAKWSDADIVIEGDEEAQLATRFSIYHLIRSNVEDDPHVSICAKGHSGEAYFGRYFWDTEIYMLPFFIYTNTKAAKNLLLFRYNTLNGARQNARNYNYEGARYAWESSITGEEQCHLWQFADNEIHVTADIIYGLWHYYSATEDIEFLTDYGLEMLIETSRYWLSRVDRNGAGEYGFIGVMGPDEYTPFTNNNSFTNRLVKFNLDKTIEALEIIKTKDKEKFDHTLSSLNITDDEISAIRKLGGMLKISYDEERKLVLQSEDFEDLAEIDMDGIWKDRTRHFIHFLTQEKLYRSKCIKQADVIALMNLFPMEFTSEEMSIAYDYYEPITTHDSSLSPSNHGILSSWIGRKEESYKYFKKASQIDLNMESYSAAEGIHIANCGGVWQMIVFGYAGLNSPMWSDEITASPRLPDRWKSVEFSIMWKGKKFRVSVDCDGYCIQAI